MRKAMTAWVSGLIGLGIGMLAGTPVEAAETVRLCTGSPGKTYVKVGQKLADLAPQLTAGALKIEIVPTGGSLDNLNRALAGECDAFITQGDALNIDEDKPLIPALRAYGKRRRPRRPPGSPPDHRPSP